MAILQPTLGGWMRIGHPTSAHGMAIRQPTSGPRISIGGTMSVPPIVIREPTFVAFHRLNVGCEHSAAEMARPMGIVQPTSGEWMRIRHPTSAHWMTIRQPTLGARICISRSMSAPSMFIRQPMFAAIQVEQCVDCHSPANNIFWNAHLIVLVTTTRCIQIVRLSRRHGHSLNKPRLRHQRPPATAYAARSSPPTRRRTAFFAAFIAVVVARAPLRSALNSL